MDKDIKKQIHDKDSIITQNHVLINKIKNDYILKNAKKPLNDKEYDYFFMNIISEIII